MKELSLEEIQTVHGGRFHPLVELALGFGILGAAVNLLLNDLSLKSAGPGFGYGMLVGLGVGVLRIL